MRASVPAGALAAATSTPPSAAATPESEMAKSAGNIECSGERRAVMVNLLRVDTASNAPTTIH
jgi:hypothetical protein